MDEELKQRIDILENEMQRLVELLLFKGVIYDFELNMNLGSDK